MNRLRPLILALLGEALLSGVAAAAGQKTSGNSVITDDLLTGAAVSANALSGTGRILAGNPGQISVGMMTASGKVIESGYYSRAVSSPAAAVFESVYSSSLTVSWSDAASSNPPGTIYKVQISTSVDYSGAAVSTASSGFSADFIHLSTGTVYYGRVSAGYMEGDDSPYKNAGSTITGGGIVPPSNPVVTGVYLSSISVSWEQGNPDNGYIVEASTASDFTGAIKSSYTPNISLTALTVEALAPNTTYYLRVGALLTASTSYAYTSPPSRCTLALPPVASATPITSVTAASMAFNWDDPGNPPGTVYLLEYTSAAFASAVQVTTTSLTPQALGLKVNTTYYARVSAVNHAGAPTAVLDLGAAATLANMPAGTSILSVSSISVSVGWDANGNPGDTAYEIWRDTVVGFSKAAQSATAGNSFLADSLAQKTTYYFKVRAQNRAGIVTGFDSIVSTRTFSAAPGNIFLSTAGVFITSISWSWNDSADEELYRISDSGGNIIQDNLVSNTIAWTETGLSTNTAYTRKGIVVNAAGVSTSAPVTVYTLAASPAGLSLLAITQSSASVGWLTNTNPEWTVYEISRWTAGGSITTSRVTGSTASLSGIMFGATNYMSICAVNGDGIYACDNVGISTFAAVSVSTVNPGGEETITFPGVSGDIIIEIPAGSFSGSAQITARIPQAQIPPATGSLTALPVRVGVEIIADKNLQPQKEAVITMYYRHSDLGALDENKLVIARYDDAHGIWVALPSVTDLANNSVTAGTNHFSLFQIMQSATPGGLLNVTVGPNPLRPVRNPGQEFVFRNLPPDSRVRIYTYAGELLRDMKADGAGMARWNGKNQGGEMAASGVYLALVESGGKKKLLQLVVEK
ncbi:MAG: fibronectin type III domain-containing protein [Elusimicrobia bacterium]|nr:fibronectin type III domain-containing protein [Elusimicrobiota bacterium]